MSRITCVQHHYGTIVYDVVSVRIVVFRRINPTSYQGHLVLEDISSSIFSSELQYIIKTSLSSGLLSSTVLILFEGRPSAVQH